MTGQTKLAKGGTVAVIALAAFLLSVWFIGPPVGTTAELARRSSENPPDFSAAALADKETFVQAEKFLTDRVRAKPWAVAAVNKAVLTATGRSPSSQVVANGEDWFYVGEFTEPCPYLTDTEAARRGLRNLQAAAEQGGRRVVFVVVPNKSTTLADRLPQPTRPLTRCSERNRAELAAMAADPGSPLVMVNPERVRQIAGADGYWQQDTHWTTSGGRALTEAIGDAIGGTGAAKKALDRQVQLGDSDHLPDLRPLLGFGGTEPTPVFGPRQPSSFTEITGVSPWPPRSFTSPDPLPGAPTLALVYDSFVYAPGLEPQIASLFPSGVLLQWDAVPALNELPTQDLVIVESAERLALGRLAAMTPEGPFAPILDYLSRP